MVSQEKSGWSLSTAHPTKCIANYVELFRKRLAFPKLPGGDACLRQASNTSEIGLAQANGFAFGSDPGFASHGVERRSYPATSSSELMIRRLVKRCVIASVLTR